MNTLHVPNLARDIVYARQLTDHFDITLSKNKFYLTPPSTQRPKNVIAEGTKLGYRYYSDDNRTPISAAIQEERNAGKVPRVYNACMKYFAMLILSLIHI